MKNIKPMFTSKTDDYFAYINGEEMEFIVNKLNILSKSISDNFWNTKYVADILSYLWKYHL